MAHKTQEQISHNMKMVKNKDSKIELTLRRELWQRKLRYRKNVTTILGKPDIAFLGKRVAVFCDSEFWHGFEWETRKREIKSNQDFWITKIEKNMARDQYVTNELRNMGWMVIRFWGKEILANPAACADIIEKALKERK